MVPRFPHRSHLQADRSFQDENGRNRFADGESAEEHSEDPFAAPAASDERPYRPGDYVATLPHRAGWVLLLGGAGLAFSLFGAAVAAADLVASPTSFGEALLVVPVALLGLALTIPGWILGGSDSRAIRAGAMDAAGRRGTRIGYWMSVVGTLLGGLILLAWPLATMLGL